MSLARTTPWLLSLGVIVVVVGGALALVFAAERSPVPPLPTKSSTRVQRRSTTDRSAVQTVHVAGSGSNVPLMRVLAKRFEQGVSAVDVRVHESIGSTGGVQATRDGAVDIGLVSRPLRPDEARNIVVHPYARAPIAIATHVSVPDSNMRASHLLNIFSGRKRTWSDGQRIVPLYRERGDSGYRAVDRRLPKFRAARGKAKRTGRVPVLYTDQAVEQALMTIRGSVGLMDWGTIRLRQLPIRVMSIGGVGPSADSVRSGVYPFAREFAMVTPHESSEHAKKFIEFVLSDHGAQLIRDGGYVRLHRPRRPGT